MSNVIEFPGSKKQEGSAIFVKVDPEDAVGLYVWPGTTFTMPVFFKKPNFLQRLATRLFIGWVYVDFVSLKERIKDGNETLH